MRTVMGTLTACALVSFMSACALEIGSDEASDLDELRAEDEDSTSWLGEEEEVEADTTLGAEPDATNCVYVEWCREPGTGLAACRLRSKPGCVCGDPANSAECARDVRAVCGNVPWYHSCFGPA
jgi:hypothetical protein